MTEVCEAGGPDGGDARAPGPLYRKLSPGPGRSVSEVASHQRSRLHGAMIEIAATRGYEAVRVRELAQLAGVSSQTFYKHFADKEACLVGTHRAIVRGLVLRVRGASAAAVDPRDRLRLALEALLEEIAEEPAAARVALIEAPAAGPEAAAEARRGEATLSSLVGECFVGDLDRGEEPAQIFTRGIVAGVTHVLRSRLLSGEEDVLPALAGELADWAYACGADSGARLAQLEAVPPSAPSARGPRFTYEDQPRDERALILSAASRLAAAEGYGSLSVPRIRAAAGVSRKCFDTHFADLDDCFLSACAVTARRALAGAACEAASADRWTTGMQRALLALFAQIGREPDQARLALLEVMTPGRDGIRLRVKLVADAAALLLTTLPPQRRPGGLAAEASVGAVWEIVCHDVAEDRFRQLPRLAPSLTLLLSAPIQKTRSAAGAHTPDRLDRRSHPLTIGAAA